MSYLQRIVSHFQSLHPGRSPWRLLAYGCALTMLLPLSLGLDLLRQACEMVGDCAYKINEQIFRLMTPVERWAQCASSNSLGQPPTTENASPTNDQTSNNPQA